MTGAPFTVNFFNENDELDDVLQSLQCQIDGINEVAKSFGPERVEFASKYTKVMQSGVDKMLEAKKLHGADRAKYVFSCKN